MPADRQPDVVLLIVTTLQRFFANALRINVFM
jgi:hypothetical protein